MNGIFVMYSFSSNLEWAKNDYSYKRACVFKTNEAKRLKFSQESQNNVGFQNMHMELAIILCY